MKKTIISIIVAMALASLGLGQVVYNVGDETTNPVQLTVTGTSVTDIVNANNNLGVKIQLDFSWDLSTGNFELTVTNVTGFASSITGLGLNYASGLDFNSFTQDAQSSGVGTFAAVENVSGSDIAPFVGTIDILAQTPNQGGPNVGIEDGKFATFTLNFSGYDSGNFSSIETFFGGLVGSDFNNDTADVSNFDMIFRVQGVAVGVGSDKIGVNFSNDDGGGGSGFVPEPSTYSMFGALALLGLMVVRQLRRR